MPRVVEVMAAEVGGDMVSESEGVDVRGRRREGVREGFQKKFWRIDSRSWADHARESGKCCNDTSSKPRRVQSNDNESGICIKS